jgi:hypothetical protein
MIAEIDIRFPVWNGGQRKVGIAPYRMNEEMLKIDIEYVSKKTGKKSYPNSFYIMREDAVKYPIMKLPSGTILHMIPIEDLWLREKDAISRSDWTI